ncbi:response regulator [Polluticoccus soli]|uniref:response regulator n=1 Tax=Polluticoccus soli TaxID=3034150 RepID=UPI0023E0FD91|nr:response regulator [Flavipsychrobacter sp. JY13-12]
MKTILLIDDNADVRMVITEVLELSNYRVLAAADGKEGILLARDKKPDLIICDIMMPVLDGYAVIHSLQRFPETQNIPFIFLSAKAERSDIRKGMELGADDYIAKPLSGPEELLNAVESRLKKADLLKKDMGPGLEGLNNLMISVNGKDMLKSLTDESSSQRYKKRQVVYNEGTHPKNLFYVQKGKVKVFKTNDDGKELVTNIYTEGDFFGYTSIIEESLYKETAQALEEAELTLIPASDFKDLLNNSREVLHKFIQLLANNVSEREAQLVGVAYNSLRKKVADALISIFKKFKKEGDADDSTIAIGRENLANFTGTAKESVIRTLSDFKDEKLIDIKDGNIVILNRRKLENMLN